MTPIKLIWNVPQTADVLGVSDGTIYKEIHRKHLQVTRVSHTIRISTTELARYSGRTSQELEEARRVLGIPIDASVRTVPSKRPPTAYAPKPTKPKKAQPTLLEAPGNGNVPVIPVPASVPVVEPQPKPVLVVSIPKDWSPRGHVFQDAECIRCGQFYPAVYVNALAGPLCLSCLAECAEMLKTHRDRLVWMRKRLEEIRNKAGNLLSDWDIELADIEKEWVGGFKK